ncbi:hypothetical protein BJ912DRAFT_956038 [Pholiota molesta]|nr:hypothetical protein BJ912DRAFT_956038 [Pholiota molesta]
MAIHRKTYINLSYEVAFALEALSVLPAYRILLVSLCRQHLAMANQAAVIPNFGRPFGRPAPIDISYLYPDSYDMKDVYIHLVTDTRNPSSRDKFWLVTWHVAQIIPNPAMPTYSFPVFRKFGLSQEYGINHLTSWGVITKSFSLASWSGSQTFLIAKLSYRARQDLERIAANEPVLASTNLWNCQDWIISILRKAELQGIVTYEWATAVFRAQKAS